MVSPPVVASRASSRQSAIVAGALAASIFLVTFGALHYGVFKRNLLVDTPLYERYGDAVVHQGKIPYRDFALEYPPAALVAFAAPSLLVKPRDFGSYTLAFEALMVAFGVAASVLVAFLLARQGASPPRLFGRALLAGLAPLLIGPVILSRFDLWPAALTAGAVAALVASRHRLAFGLLGLAVAAKLYPAVILPPALVYVWRRRGRREALLCAAGTGAVIAALTAPLALLASGGVWDSFAGQASRPLQLESAGAGILLAAHHALGLGVMVVFSHGSNNLGGHAAKVIAWVQSLVEGVAIVGLWVAFARGTPAPGRFLRYAAACVCAFVAFGKVLSPQYLIWLIALVLVVPGVRGDLAAALLAAAMVITQLWFPSHYISLAYNLDPRASWLVLARDLTLVGLFLTLMWPARHARSWGAATVAPLVLLAGAAAAVAAVSAPVRAGAMHSGLLNETGVASRCGASKPVPSVTDGSAAYDTVALANAAPRSRCIRVALESRGSRQLFAVAYRGDFTPTDPQARYLGDSGICTNIAGATGPTGRLAFVVPARTRFVLDVEACSSGELTVDSALDVRTTSRPVAGFARATATRTARGIRFAWQVRRPARTLEFLVYRYESGRETVVGRFGGTASLRSAHLVPGLPIEGAATYAIAARTATGSWEWRGPLRPD